MRRRPGWRGSRARRRGRPCSPRCGSTGGPPGTSRPGRTPCGARTTRWCPSGSTWPTSRRKGAKNGLGKDPDRAAERAAQLSAIDEDWDCPWPLDWQRRHRVLADLVDAGGQLPDIAPGVLMDGDDIGKWLQQQKQPAAWARLLPEQQERLTKLGVQPAQAPSPTPAVSRGAKGAEQSAAGVSAGPGGARTVGGAGRRPPACAARPQRRVVAGTTEPVVVKLGVWVSNTKTRRDKLDAEQRAALGELGVDWA